MIQKWKSIMDSKCPRIGYFWTVKIFDVYVIYWSVILESGTRVKVQNLQDSACHLTWDSWLWIICLSSEIFSAGKDIIMLKLYRTANWKLVVVANHVYSAFFFLTTVCFYPGRECFPLKHGVGETNLLWNILNGNVQLILEKCYRICLPFAPALMHSMYEFALS